MATSPNQGIMGLQEDYFSKGMLPPEMGLEVADGVMKNLNPQLMPVVDGLTSEISGQLAELSDEELDIFIQLVQQLYDEPENYAENRAYLIQGGDLTEEDLPPEYDPEALATMLFVLRKEKQMRMGSMSNMSPGQGTMPPMAGAAPEMMQPPQGFARGGIAEAARLVAGSGRNGDTMLAHITPREAKLLRKHGGSGTINPVTGLREYGFFKFLKKAWNVVWQPVKKALNTTAGKIISQIALNILIPGFGSIIASGLQTAAAGGNFGDIVKSMAISGATSFLSGGLAKQGFPSPIQSQLDSIASGLTITSEVGKQALSQGLVTTGMGLAQGQNLKDAATSGMTAAATVQAADFLGKTYKDFKGAQAGAPDKAPVVDYDINTGKPMGASNMPERFTADGSKVTTARYDMGMGNANPPLLEGVDVPYQGKLAGVDYPYSSTASTANQSQLNAGSSTAVPPPVNTSGSTSFKPVDITDAGSMIGKGTRQFLTGDFSEGASNIYQGGKDLFFPSSPSVTNILDSDDYKTAVSRGMDPKLAYAEVSKNLEPGFMRTYGPGAAAAAGAMYLGGAFDQPEEGPSPAANQMKGTPGLDLIKADPRKYLVQGLPGVNYDANGNIINSQGPYNRFTMPDIAVKSTYPQYADGGEVGHYAFGGIATGTATADPNAPLDPNARLVLGGVDVTDMFKTALAKVNAPNASYKATPTKYTTNVQAYTPFTQEDINIASSAYTPPANYAPSTAAPTYKQFTREDVVMPSKGIAALATGGYPRKTGQISGPGTEKSDSIPAMLSDGEFVMTAKAVRGLGKGSRREGAKRMYALMHQLERNAARG